MYNDFDKFYIIDRNYDVVEVIEGIQNLSRKTAGYRRQHTIADSFDFGYTAFVDGHAAWVKPGVKWIIHDSNGWVVSCDYLKTVSYKASWERNHPRDRRHSTYGRVPAGGNWEFRKDPVPGTGKGRYHGTYRNRKMMCDIRASQCEDVRIRPRRLREIKYDVWDDKWDGAYRSCMFNQKSWKTQTKNRKQWMK